MTGVKVDKVDRMTDEFVDTLFEFTVEKDDKTIV